MDQVETGVILLEDTDAKVEILPEVGGSIARYTFRGKDVLRPTRPDISNALDSDGFPLVPFANRIAYGKFSWNGRAVSLKPNFGNEPHALHGKGWQSSWRVVSQAPEQAVLRYDHAASDWPWIFFAELNFALEAGALHARLSITNTSAESMPVSLGFHPFFPRCKSSKLTASLGGVWLTDAMLIPTQLAGPAHFLDLAHGASIGTAKFVDNCHTGWDGHALIEQPEEGLRIRLSASSTFLHIFTPTDETYFCVEPVTAMPDAVNRPEPPETTGLQTLKPGATFSLSMMIAPEA
jgi:aldose 1-epimerase